MDAERPKGGSTICPSCNPSPDLGVHAPLCQDCWQAVRASQTRIVECAGCGRVVELRGDGERFEYQTTAPHQCQPRPAGAASPARRARSTRVTRE